MLLQVFDFIGEIFDESFSMKITDKIPEPWGSSRGWERNQTNCFHDLVRSEPCWSMRNTLATSDTAVFFSPLTLSVAEQPNAEKLAKIFRWNKTSAGFVRLNKQSS